ncbi:hypothetical protein Y1Q_0002221 [Alligator mississippiensis]|uniref:Uncharacterized protein n=1 Tax=Alligator mississippiensis TaxID=8496 RepID=A0A151MLK8_ALLMI|nr:hypothetical protein Y1Q_0002221 [Alligator mississippiensis]
MRRGEGLSPREDSLRDHLPITAVLRPFAREHLPGLELVGEKGRITQSCTEAQAAFSHGCLHGAEMVLGTEHGWVNVATEGRPCPVPASDRV